MEHDHYDSEKIAKIDRSLGDLSSIEKKVSSIELTVEQFRAENRSELNLLQRRLHATEADLIGLLTVILQRHVARENRLEALEQAYERLTQLRKSLPSLGNEIPEIASILEGADAALSGGKGFSLDEAEKALALAYQRYNERVLGPEHPDTATGYNNLASNLDKQGRATEAEPLYRKALDINERVRGTEHPYTAAARGNLEIVLKKIGKSGS